MMTLNTSTLRPGLLVSLKTQVIGNVQYAKHVIESEHVTEEGHEKARWETERTVIDPAEHEASKKARGRARTIITSVCANSAFGLLCPQASVDKLEKAIAEARAVADEFNATANLTRISVYVITGRIAPDDLEAVRAINSEVRDLLQEMATGVANLDVKMVRDAANKARGLGTMLSTDASNRIQEAVEAARGAARQIVKAGEEAAQEIDKATIQTLVAARTAFLDLDDAKDIATPAATARAIDLPPPSAKPTKARRQRAAVEAE